MKTVFNLLIVTVLFTNFAHAQLSNLDFENWTNDDPDGWFSFDQLAPFDICVQEIDAHSGNYAAKVQTVDVGGDVYSGVLAFTNFSEDETESGIPYTLRPTEFSFWAKYSTAGNDSVIIVAQLTKWNGNEAVVVGEAGEIFIGTSNTYTQYTPQFTYTSSDTPDSLQFIILVVQPDLGIATLGSYVIIDDIEILGGGSSAPAAPTNLTATLFKTDNTGVRLNWQDNSNNETSFKIERSTNASGPFTEIGTVLTDVTTYDDVNVSNGTTYYYRVLAANGNGSSAPSNVFNVEASGITSVLNNIEAEIKLYPNPSNGNFKIVLPNDLNNSTVSVFDIAGKEIYSTVVNEETNIKINAARGNYYVKIQHEKNTFNKRIVVE